MKIMQSCLLLFATSTAFSMEEKVIKTIRTKKVRASYGLVTNFYEAIEYSPDSQSSACRYIR